MNLRTAIPRVGMKWVVGWTLLGLAPVDGSAGVDPLSWVETPAASGAFTAAVTNAFDGIGVAQADDWTLEAEAGDRLTARIEAAVGSSRPRLRLLNPSGQTVASADGETSGVAEFYNAPLAAPGTYRVRVYTDNQVSDYRLRVDVARGPTLEVEPNNSATEANLPDPTLLAGSYRLRVAGVLTTNDTAGDWFDLGLLDPGNAIAAELFTGPYSTLQTDDPTVSILRDNHVDPVFSANTNFTFVVTVRGVYSVRVTSTAHRDLLARYFLTLTITDDVPPSVVDLTLPENGTTATSIINAFTVTFSEPMDIVSANDLAHYSLSHAGPDNLFGTADDVVYPLLPPNYLSGTNVVFALGDGPLQPGACRFTIAATVTDRAGNPLTPALTWNFSIERLGMFQFENRANDTPATATSLSLTPANTPDGSFQPGASVGAGNSPYFVAAGLFNGDAILDLAVANFGSDNVSIFLGNGDATFQPATNFPAANGPL
ncbi:MAG: Ig-like domain-containing protein, partial [Verrucomicrobia bacterium]|nr:Ig-like domain-containing protein [Verrucomicrobiota bacterium]